jgi:uncharacterized protein (TIGR02452 family)
MDKRIKCILECAIVNNIRIICLGVFGCGVYRNDPSVIADIFHKYLVGKGWSMFFDKIVFPILPGKGKVDAYLIFKERFSGETSQ